MSETERDPFQHSKSDEGARVRGKAYRLSIEDVLSKRDILHQTYHPKDLHYLEFMIKTKPRKPAGVKYWLNRLKEQKITIEGSDKLDLQNPSVLRVCEGCAGLDARRYAYEKSAWFTTLLQVDKLGDNFTLRDFQSEAIKRCEQRFNQAIKNPNEPGPVRIRRPRGPFSLWIEDYRYMIRDERPEFQFGDHLRMCAESWSKLSNERKKELQRRSEQLKKNHLEKMKVFEEKFNLQKSEQLCKDIFKHDKSQFVSHPSHLVPEVPTVRDLFTKSEQVAFKKSHLKDKWESMSDTEKSPYLEQWQQYHSLREEKRKLIKTQLQEIKDSVRKAQELARLKKKLGMVRNDKRRCVEE